MQALKNVAIRLLNIYVGPYVENLDTNALNGSLWSGQVNLKNLHLKKSLLERFGLPVEIVAGDIGSLSLSIPWNALKSQPVKVVIDDVYILARARPQGKVDPEEDERVEQATKQDKLKSAEAVDNAASQVGHQEGNDEEKQTYVGAIVSKIVDNVQIQIKGIHIRYEDGSSTPEHPFAAGITLNEFKAISTDENWVESFIQNSLNGVHKLVKLGALAVYFDTDTGSLDKGADDRQGTIDALKAMLDGSPNHQYILRPVTGEARAIINKTMSSDMPKVDAQVMFDEIGVVVDRDQYRDALSVVDVFHFYRRTHQYHKFRPPEDEFKENPAKARLKFALDSIRSEVHEKNKRWSWDYLRKRRDTRKKYVDLYVQKLALTEGKQLPVEDGAALAEIETQSSYEDIRFFRSVARAQAKKDAATRRKLEAERIKNQPHRATWSEWVWGSSAKTDQGDSGMSEEEKKEIDDIIDYDANAASENVGTTPRDFMRARLSAKLNKGSFSLRTDPHGKNSDIIALVFDSFSADAVQLTDSMKGKMALGGFRVYDGTTPDSLYPQIVRVKDIEESSKGKTRQESLDVEGGVEGAVANIDAGLPDDADPFFVMEVEQNPLDGRADNAVTIKMRHLEIIYHKGYVEAVVQFFKPPESQLESIGALLDAAGQTLDGIRKETRAGLEYALEQHKTVDIQLDMNAPIIIIPMDVKVKQCQTLVLDAGHISIGSKLADKEKLADVQSKRGRQYSDDDYKKLEDLMYDRFDLNLQSAQLLMGGNVDACMSALDDQSSGSDELHVLERINMSFSVQNAIANAPNLTKFKVAGHLPELHVNFSDRKYKTLMKFIDVAIPKFGEDAAPQEPAPALTHNQSRAVFRSAQIEEYNFDDTRSIVSHHTATDKDDSSSLGKGEQFYEARDDQTEKSAMRQISFEFSFSVGRLQASLYKSTSPTSEKAFADAVLEDFGLTFALRKYDMSVDLYLKSVALAMIEGGSARKPILSSANNGETSPTDLKLLKVRYLKVQKESPEFMTRHEGVDTSIDVELSTFDITLAPEPILSLYDFIMTTFVPNDEQPQVVTTGEDSGQLVETPEQPESTDKLRIRVKLTSAQVSLENNGNKFALLGLPSADVALLLRAGTLRIGARLGDITLEDLSDSSVAEPSFKKLLSIEGEELADFSYETFDPNDKETFPGYNSSVHLRTGSLKFTFMEGPVRDLYSWALKFARMKAIYDAAQQAAVQRASEVTRMHFDVVIKTPIIVLPRDGLTSTDILILRLGEVVAKNEYLNDPDDTSTIDATLRGINVASEITVDGKKGQVQMVNDVAITAAIKQAGGSSHRSDPHHADMEITTEMSDVKLALTQRQYVLLLSVLEALPRALNDLGDADVSPESIPATPASISRVDTPNNESPSEEEESRVNLEPELAVAKLKDRDSVQLWTALDFVFSVGTIALEVYTNDAIAPEDLKNTSIARFALVKTHLGFKKLSDGAMEAEFSLKTLSFSSTRSGNSVFRDIIPPAPHDGNQIMFQYTMAGGSDQSSLAIVTIDSPRFILAVDPLAALLEFAVAPFKKSADAEAQHVEQEQLQDIEEAPKQNGGLAFRVEVIDATVIVIADDTNPKTQAIQLSIKEVLLSQQSILALKVERIGMSFGRMDRPNDRVKFLDDLNVALSLDTRRKGAQQMTSFEVEIPDPIIFRASYTDMMLITDIVNKATAVATKALAPESDQTQDSPQIRRDSLTNDGVTESTSMAVVSNKHSRRTSVGRKSSISKRRSSVDKAHVLISKEQLKARINGFQLVLVGDLQEMPMVHLSTSEFQVLVNDWSGDMKMATSITTSIRYFNLTNSYFEPLMDPWKFDLRVNRLAAGPGHNPLNVRLTASERLELNLSSAFIELAITSMTVWNREKDRAKESRGTDAPFRIRNRTGLTILLWPEQADLSKQVTGVKRLDEGADVPWRFEDRKHTRDNVSAVRHNALGIQLQDTPWEALRGISVDREGDHILTLRPRLDKVSHQITCEIKLENNIKVITFRSTLNVENQTSLPIEMIVVDSHGKASSGAMKIGPGESCPLPLEAAFEKRFRLRPLRGFGFDYSWSMPLHWRQLVSKPIRPISCKHQTPKEPAFYFQAQANFDAKDPAAKIYPRMSLTLRAPVELENLLPYDLKFRIHDKNTGLSSSNFLVKGGSSPIHTVELGHLLLLSVAPEDTNLKQSDYAIINTDDVELPIEDHFQLADEQGLKLMLKLHYYTYPNSGGAFKVQVYSPFIFMNKTGLPFDLAAKTWTGGQRPIAGKDLFANDYHRETPTPFMFGFPNEDRRNRLFLRVDDSKWSQPISFEPVSADMQIIMTSASGESDNYVGLSYTEGIGKYKLTKVITIAPRFLLKNTFAYPLKIRQHSTQNVVDVAPGQRVALHELQHQAPSQLSMAFDEPNLKWSAPFNMSDIGRTHITLQRQTARGQKTYLLRVDTHLEGSSVFIYVSRDTDQWPLRLRNDTGISLKFQQVDEDGTRDKRPLRFLPAKSEQDYAWDWPTATNKRIRLLVENGPDSDPIPLANTIDMMAIGIQPPMKVPRTANSQRSAALSIDVQADGGSQLLTLSLYNEETSVYKPTKRGAGGIRRTDSSDTLSSAAGAYETVSVNDKPSLNISVEFEGIGISVITKRPDELLYVSVRGLKLGYSDYPQYYDAFVDCKWIQIDNQLFGGLFPIILYPTVVPKDGKELESHPTLQASVAVLKDQSHGVVFVKYATILLQSMTVELDEDFMFALLDFVKFKDAAWKEETHDILIEHPKDIPEPDALSTQADVFFEALQLQPVSLELSFMRTDRVNVDEKVSTRNPFYYAINALTMALGNVNAAPLTFRALFLENVRLSVPSLQERVQLHYQEQFMSQIYRVLGSADFLGNPVGLFNNISSGFSDIFYEPYQGIVMHGNKDIGLGIARGATSFAKKTVFGISDSMTKFTGSIGKGLSAATLDTEYQTKRRMTRRRNKPKHALYGVAAGASAFADSVTSAFEGVASKPIEGAEKEGAIGFTKGIGKGFVGLFTKPVVGVMDFVSSSTEGIRNTTTVFDQTDLDRVRLPRFISADGVLRPFSDREALGQSWLKDLDAGAFFHDSYVAHIDLPGDDAVSILSNNRIVQVQLRRLKVIWQVPFEELASLSLEANGINLLNRDGRGGPFLPISEQTAREWYFKQIGRVVVAYNKAHSQRDD
uniref:Vacuolar protein sorting-associated protein n=1 Tax=Kwoniella pini CBS 10737 TaxID=1296096 RepID=A0A1B9IE57_9TREE|nr:vacuolar protein sorting-associated protein vps13 [Kwoniella pini CBS 10737]OCF53836.1 vacuolar protein sorting-associated protein vps13 [Kwoniella pini CBS 10737]